MVKSKRDLKSPRRRTSLTLGRPSTRSRPATSISTSANIKVVVRVRPTSTKEQDDNLRNVIKVVDDQMLIFDPKEDEQPFFYRGVQQRGRDLLKKSNKDLQFIFDKVFGNSVTNDEVFKDTTQDLINSLMDGYNCSVFAYGATGAGKTFTMIGNSEHPGITYLTMEELFNRKEQLSSERNFELAITYLEVYNEQVQDLLNPGPALHLREDGKYGVLVAGIKLHKIDQVDDLFTLLEEGNKNRTQHPTDANAESSRSHAVFQVYIHMKIKLTEEVRMAKLSMIDLAGSERGSATGFAGARFAEGANINKSLLALGNCINSLADGQRHVPYRDSKLTRLLKDSLGGNCQTVMIANVSPSSLSFEDTYNTLKYATRAKKIKSNMKRNIVNVELHVSQYVKMVEDLQKEIASLKKQKIVQPNVEDVDPSLYEPLKKLFEEKQKLIKRKYQIEGTEQGLNLRRLLKKEADARLSGLCIDTPERTEAHRKIGNSVNRFQKQEDTLKEAVENMDKSNSELDLKISDYIKIYPQLKLFAEQEYHKLSIIEDKNKLELAQRRIEILEDELQSRGDMLEKMSELLQPCFMSLRGHGLTTEQLVKDYNALVCKYQGVKSIKWVDGAIDSGVSSSSINTDDENRPIKRKNDENIHSSSALDNTFTLTPNKPKVKVCAEHLMAKVYKPPPPKRLARNHSVSPRIKDMKSSIIRKPLSTIEVKGRNNGRGDFKAVPISKSLSSRPPFRR